jgi:TonB family protein
MVSLANASSQATATPSDKLVKLNEKRIRSSVVDKPLTPDRKLNQQALRFGEVFGADGIWKSTRADRELRMLEGNWTIKDDRLCVTVTKSPWGRPRIGDIRCRTVWQNPASGAIAMTDIGSGAGTAIIQFEPRLTMERTARPMSDQPWVPLEHYPPAALRDGREGTSYYTLRIGTDRRPKSCAISKSSGFADLDEAACIFLMKTRWSPALDKSGNPVESIYSNKLTWRAPK